MTARVRLLLALSCLLLIAAPVMPSPALAAPVAAHVSCDAKGASGEFFSTSLLGKSCQEANTSGVFGSNGIPVFSTIVCNFIRIMNQVMVTLYCGMQSALLPVLVGAITLYVVVFGAQLLMGTAQLAGGEIAKHLLKIGLVWTFAAQGADVISMIYTFFIGFSLQAIDWVLRIIEYCGCVIPHSFTNVFERIDSHIYEAVSDTLFSEKAELLAFFMIMSFVCPPLFMVLMSLLWMTITIFVRSLIGFLMGVSAVAFLIVLSPIFLSFMLFKSTAHLFDNWLRYIISYSLQPVITFACLALWIGITSNFLNFTDDLAKTLMPYDGEGVTTGVEVTPVETVGFCPLAYPPASNDKFAPGPRIACKDGDKSKVDRKKVLPPSLMVKEKKFMYFLAYHLITLLVIAYAFSAMLKSAPDIARQLTGAYAPSLGVGSGMGFGGLRSAFAGMPAPSTGVADATAGPASLAMQGIRNQFSNAINRRNTPKPK